MEGERPSRLRGVVLDVPHGTEEWYRLRRLGVTASESPCVLGVYPFKSALRLWAEKTGRIEPEEAGEAADWGRLLQATIAEEWSRREGVPVREAEVLCRHPEHEWMLATPDYWILGEDGEPEGILEIKLSANPEWRLGLPEWVRVQVLHQLEVTGLERAVVACLFEGRQLRTFTVDGQHEFSVAMRQQIVRSCERFYQHLVSDTPPEPSGLDIDDATLAQLFPFHQQGREVRLEDPEWELIDRNLERLKDERRRIDKMIAMYEQQLKLAMGDAEIAVLPHGVIYTWRTHHRAGYTVEPRDVRVLRRRAK